MERRRTPRINLSWMASLKIEDKVYGCNLKNLNNGGALLVMNEKYNDKIEEDCVGCEASLTIKYNRKSDRVFNGKIVRIEVDHRSHKVAIQFSFKS